MSGAISARDGALIQIVQAPADSRFYQECTCGWRDDFAGSHDRSVTVALACAHAELAHKGVLFAGGAR